MYRFGQTFTKLKGKKKKQRQIKSEMVKQFPTHVLLISVFLSALKQHV